MQTAISQITTLPAELEVDLPAFSRAGFGAVELSLEKVTKYVQQKSTTALRDYLDTLRLTAVGAIGLAPKGPALLLSRGDKFSTYIASLRQQLALCRQLKVQKNRHRSRCGKMEVGRTLARECIKKRAGGV